MEWMIAHGGAEGMEKYNCSALSAAEWTSRDGIRHPIAGILCMVYGILIECMYIPCMMVICSKDLISFSCFKIMCLLGITDMLAIMVNSIFTGYFLYEGAVFCTHPELIFFTGTIGLGMWCMACMICLILVINRLVDIWRPDLSSVLFEGWGMVAFLVFPIIYGIYFTGFTPPVLFTSKHMAWFFDPAIYPNRAMEYQSPMHSANNLFVVGFTCALYAFFCFALGNRFKSEMTVGSSANRAHKQIFIQSSVICFVNMGASVIYVIMQFFPVPPYVIVAGHIAWQLGHGCPTIIYLVMNRTIRGGVFRMFGYKELRSIIVTTSGGRRESSRHS